MPDKEGSDDEKTTKGVVKKKKKQMMGEEGYDTYRDNILMRGGDHRSKETKEKSYTPSEQPKGQTAAQKAAKGKSALELVKASITKKYGKGAIMDVKKKSKKKANEELDLTKIAEAFGGYIVEANGDNEKKLKNTNSQRARKVKTSEILKKERKYNQRPLPKERPDSSSMAKEMAKKYMKLRGNNKSDIDDFIGAEDPFNVAKKQAEKDIKKTPVDPRFSGKEDEFASDTQSSKPQEKNILRKKGGRPKPGSVKFTQRPGEAPVKITRDPSVIDPKFAKKKTPKPKVDVEDDQDYKKAAKSFKKDIGGEKIISPTMQDRLEKATKGPRKARRRRSDAASFAQVKADIDTADAARKAKGKGEYASDYEKRLAKAYDKSLEDTVKTGRAPAGSPLPQAKTKTPQGQPQKGQADQSDAAQEFNKQQNQLRKLSRDRMADSGATPFKQPPFPDPKTGPSSKLTFSKFQQDQQKRFAQNKKDMEAADAYKQTPEYKLQTQQVDPDTKEILSKDELKRRFQMQKRGIVSPERKEAERKEAEIEKNVPKDQSKIDLDRDSLKSGIGGFERGRQGTLTRRGSDPRNEKSPNVETMPQQIGRKARTMADKTQTGQMSYLGALGGFVTKGVSSSAAGVANAIRSMNIAKGVSNPKAKKNTRLAKVVPPEDLAMAAAAGGAIIPQVKGVFDRVKGSMKGPLIQGGRVGRRSAPS